MKPVLENKGVTFHYDIIDTFTAGIKLLGGEVKSIRNGRGKLTGSYVTEKHGRLYLTKAFIPGYQIKTSEEMQYRDREILVTKSELLDLTQKRKEGGLTLIPLSLGLQGQRIVLSCALAKGKKKYDKRQAIKKKDDIRMLDRLKKLLR